YATFVSAIVVPLPFFFFLLIPTPPSSPLFPYTTLFRSSLDQRHGFRHGCCGRCRQTSTHRSRFRSRDRERSSLARLNEKWGRLRSEEHTSELQSLAYLVCRLLLEKKKSKNIANHTKNSQ